MSCALTNADRWQEGSHAQRQGWRVAELVNLLAIAQVWHAEDVLINGARLHVVVVSDVLIKMRPREDVIPALVHSHLSHSRRLNQQVTLLFLLYYAVAKGNDEEPLTDLSRVENSLLRKHCDSPVHVEPKRLPIVAHVQFVQSHL